MGKWDMVRLVDVCEIITDGTHQTPEYCDKLIGYPFLSSKNVTKEKIDWDDIKYIPKELHETLYKRLSPRLNDILLAKNGTTGVAALVDRDCVFDIYVSLALLRPKKIIDPPYLLKAINNPYTKRQFQSHLKGIGVPNLHLSEIRETKIPLPPLHIQQKIADVLDRANSLIEKRKTQIEKLDLLVKSQFVEMFGDPVTNPKRWEIEKMGNYMTTLTDFSANGSYETLDSQVKMYDEPNYAYMVRTTDLENNDFLKNVKYINENAYNLLSKSKIFGNEIIMNKIGSAGKVYLMPCLNMPVSLGRNAFLFRYNEKVNIIFMYYLLISEYGKREINQYVKGAVTKTITKDDVRAVKIIVPPLELQNQFATFVECVEAQKSQMKKGLELMELEYKLLMQKCFNGEGF